MSLSFLSFLPAVDRGLKSMKVECDLHECHSRQVIRSIPGARQGIRVGQQWYCSVDCFALAARTPLAALASRRIVEIPRNPRLSLGLAMHAKGYLSAEQLRYATARCVPGDEGLAEAAVRLGFATEKQVAAARAVQWGYPALAQDYVGLMVQADIPRAILEACFAVPLHYSVTAKRVLLGFVTRVEHSVLEPIEQMTGCRVEPCFITPSEFEEQMERLTVFPDYEETVVHDPGTPAKMARTIGRAAVDIGAREASFTQFKSLVWARVSGKRGKVDVVFHVNRAAEEPRLEKFGVPDQSVASLG